MKIKKQPLSIYIHIPFCKRKCLYCDFLSSPACGQERESYVKALLREISLLAEKCTEYEVISIFLGGGTPSLLSKKQLHRILSAVRKGYCLSKNAEITMECNPKTAGKEKLAFFAECGINRLSIGLQSANDKELQLLGRIHSYNDFLNTFRAAREVGFRNINVDIMSALPGQDLASYEDTLQKVMELSAEHISAYSLIIEEGTPFFDRYGREAENTFEYPPLPDEDTERRMYHRTRHLLKQQGYDRYEISNYAKKGYECRHNLTYWTGGEYLGFGIGAASYWKGERFKNNSDIEAYGNFFLQTKTIPTTGIHHAMQEEIHLLTQEEQMEEFMFLGLRLKKGISALEFEKRFGRSLYEVYGTQLKELTDQKLLLIHKQWICLSQRGTDVANYVMAQFLLS